MKSIHQDTNKITRSTSTENGILGTEIENRDRTQRGGDLNLALKIENVAENHSTIRIDLNKYNPGCNRKMVIFRTGDGQLVFFIHGNGNLKGRETTPNEFFASPSINQ